MNAGIRRKQIMTCLEQTEKPVNASQLAKELSVSRQSIVGDIALLRAQGLDIVATPRGYVLASVQEKNLYHIACIHTPERMCEELYTIVDHGCTVRDVIVEHSVYGQLTGTMNLSSRYDVNVFMKKIERFQSQPISALTDGKHLHTLYCPDEEHLQRVKEALKEIGILCE